MAGRKRPARGSRPGPTERGKHNDLKMLATIDGQSLAKLVMGLHKGMITTDFETVVKNRIDKARHPG